MVLINSHKLNRKHSVRYKSNNHKQKQNIFNPCPIRDLMKVIDTQSEKENRKYVCDPRESFNNYL